MQSYKIFFSLLKIKMTRPLLLFPFLFLLNSLNIGMHALFSYRAQMTSLNFQTTVEKNEAKLNSFVQFENEMTSYLAL